MGLWLLQFELHSLGLHWVEIHDAGYTSLAWISIGSWNFLPVASLVLIVELPAVWYLATAPWLVVVPIYGAGLDLLARSEEHTSELQSRFDLVCRLLHEKKKKKNKNRRIYIKIENTDIAH